MADDLAKKGMEVRTQLFGERAAKAGHEYLKEFDPGFADFLNEQVFGAVWGRPGLQTKIRSFITMAALTALGRAPELKIHMRGALNLGLSLFVMVSVGVLLLMAISRWVAVLAGMVPGRPSAPS